MKKILQDNEHVTSNSAQIAVLKEHFPGCFDKEGAFLAEKLQAIVKSAGVGVSHEGYSLDWLGRSYARLLANENVRTLLKADKAHNALPDNAESKNLLIKGDNLEVLKHLLGAYREQVKMIYIDPPYNTGSDGFVYADDRKFTVDELSRMAGIDEEQATRVLDFTNSKSNSHSAWLTFMYPRLYVARRLLRDDGVIFVSIDDNEQAQLKLLMDEVFGEENCAVSLYAQVRYADKTLAEKNDYQKLIEQIFVYQKTEKFSPLKQVEDYSLDKFKWEIIERTNGQEVIIGNKRTIVYKEGEWEIKKTSSGIDALKETWATGTVLKANASGKFFGDFLAPRKDVDGLGCLYKVMGIGDDGLGFRFFTGARKASATKGKFYSGVPLNRRNELFSGGSVKEKPINNFFDMSAEFGNCRHEGGVDFRGGKKPVLLLERLIRMSTDSNDLVLDFFAGSGTTADAVMQLNAEDGGSRQFICVQLDEKTDPKSEAYEAGYHSIFDITRERIKRAAAKIKADKPEYAGDLGCKVFETIPVFDGYLDDPEELTDNLEIFDGSHLGHEERQNLLLTWAAQDGIPLTENLEALTLHGLDAQDQATTDYTAYRGSSKKHILYLVDNGLTIDHVVALLVKMDEDEGFAPTRIIAFESIFTNNSKTKRELDESIRHFDKHNRKSLPLELEYRY